MMECPLKNGNGDELLVAYSAGSLAPEVEFALDQHLERCESCRSIAEAQRELWAALDSWTALPVSPDFNQRLHQRIAAEERSKGWRRLLQANWSWRPALPLAAVCAALLVAVLLRDPGSERETPVQVVQTPQIEQVERALDDMDMLKQLIVTTPAEPTATEEI